MMNIAKRAVKWLIAEALGKFLDRPLPPITREQELLVQDLRYNISKYCADVKSNLDITAHWWDTIKRFEKAVTDKDPREFLRWEECRPLTAGPGVFPQYFALRKSKKWASRWRFVLEDAPVGHPYPFFLYPKVGANIILHAYHIDKFERFAGKAISDFDVVVEFGGGYGGLCRLIHKLGFRGKYILFDLPQQTMLQNFYLKAAKMPVVSEDDKNNSHNGIYFQFSLENFISHFQNIKSVARGNKLFIATWSLSECPISLRECVSSNIIDHCDYMLISFQERYKDIDNIEYFARWKEIHSNVLSIKQERIPMRQPADFYFFGRRNY